jgi:hypothetical protein
LRVFELLFAKDSPLPHNQIKKNLEFVVFHWLGSMLSFVFLCFVSLAHAFPMHSLSLAQMDSIIGWIGRIAADGSMNRHDLFPPGLVDTAVKTSEIGYVQRKFTSTTNDVVVQYDGSVRDIGTGRYLSRLYGNDGFDCSHHEKQIIPCLTMSEEQYQNYYGAALKMQNKNAICEFVIFCPRHL